MDDAIPDIAPQEIFYEGVRAGYVMPARYGEWTSVLMLPNGTMYSTLHPSKEEAVQSLHQSAERRLRFS
jgi:hypothetical protein